MDFRFFLRLAVVGLILSAAALAVRASEVHVSEGLALKGYDVVAYFREGVAARGQELKAEHGGATYLFSKPEHRDAFLAEPARYLPQYGGYCAFGASRGYKADIDPAAFSVIDGKLYLNYNGKVQQEWLKDSAGYIRRADERWPEVRLTTKVLR